MPSGMTVKTRADLLEELGGWHWHESREPKLAERWTEFWAFVDEHGRMPRNSAKDPAERSVFNFFNGRRRSDRSRYDQDHREMLKVKERFWWQFATREEKWAACWAFIDEHGRRPKRGRDAMENRLAVFLSQREQYEPRSTDVVAVHKQFPPWSVRCKERWADYWAFVDEHGHKPRGNGSRASTHERSLARFAEKRRKVDPRDPELAKIAMRFPAQSAAEPVTWATYWAFVGREGRKPSRHDALERRLSAFFDRSARKNPSSPNVLKVAQRFPGRVMMAPGSPEWLRERIHTHGDVYPRRSELGGSIYAHFVNLRMMYREGLALNEEDFYPEVWRFLTFPKGKRDRKPGRRECARPTCRNVLPRADQERYCSYSCAGRAGAEARRARATDLA